MCPSDNWQLVRCDNHVNWDNDPLEDEALMVSIPGVRKRRSETLFRVEEFVAHGDRPIKPLPPHHPPPPERGFLPETEFNMRLLNAASMIQGASEILDKTFHYQVTGLLQRSLLPPTPPPSPRS